MHFLYTINIILAVFLSDLHAMSGNHKADLSWHAEDTGNNLIVQAAERALQKTYIGAKTVFQANVKANKDHSESLETDF